MKTLVLAFFAATIAAPLLVQQTAKADFKADLAFLDAYTINLKWRHYFKRQPSFRERDVVELRQMHDNRPVAFGAGE